MSELLRIASALRRASDADLKAVISQRLINSSGLRDFFDLADSLSQPKSVASTVAGLPKTQIDALVAIVEGREPEPKAAASLARMMLIERTAEDTYALFESTAFCLQSLEAPTFKDALPATAAPTQAEVDRDSGIATFETLQALTELVFDVEQRYIREVGKKNVGLPDIKRLAQHVRQGNEFAREIYELANHADLIGLVAGRWQLGPQASNWLTWQPEARHRHLVTVWRTLLGESSAGELVTSIRAVDEVGVVSLSNQLRAIANFSSGLTCRANRAFSRWLVEQLGTCSPRWRNRSFGQFGERLPANPAAKTHLPGRPFTHCAGAPANRA
ncbi:MAG: hypothetical protein RL529_180 [Actinomycetota bacterium]